MTPQGGVFLFLKSVQSGLVIGKAQREAYCFNCPVEQMPLSKTEQKADIFL